MIIDLWVEVTDSLDLFFYEKTFALEGDENSFDLVKQDIQTKSKFVDNILINELDVDVDIHEKNWRDKGFFDMYFNTEDSDEYQNKIISFLKNYFSGFNINMKDV